MARERLPNRRASELLNFEHDNVRYVGSVSRFTDGRIAEVFIDSQKVNASSGILARDSAIAASLAFQFGCPVRDLRAALTRQENGGSAGPLAKFLDLVGKSDTCVAFERECRS
jgi:hypothetical protein